MGAAPDQGDARHGTAGDAQPETDAATTGGTTGGTRPGWVRRHKVLTGLIALFAVVLVSLGGFAVYLNSILGDIDRVDAFGTLPDERRPPPSQANPEALNILLAGADNGDASGPSIAELMAGDWESGAYRSDTLMVLHIPEDRQDAYLVSIPRDSYVELYDANGEPQGMNKINAAFSLYGPSGAIATVENLTDTRMDHLAVIDWKGFKDITDALGGVRIFVPETISDYQQDDFTLDRGWNDLDGEQALKYVRSRYVLSDGDLGRIDRQQNFLRAMVDQITDTGLVSSPGTFSSTFSAIADNLTVDESWSNGDLRGLAWSMRGLRADDMTLMTVPLDANDPYPTIEGAGSTVNLDEQGLGALFEVVRDGDVAEYVEQNPDLLAPEPRDVQ